MSNPKVEHKILNGVELKKCSTCKEWKSLDSFNKNKSRWDNLHSQCKSCVNQWRLDNPDYMKNWCIKNPNYMKQHGKQYCVDNPDYHKQYYHENTKQRKKYSKQYRVNNPDKRNALEAKRRALKRNVISKDTNLEAIQFIYALCAEWNAEKLNGFEYHVDHIQPLSKGGLHHEDNLQILPVFLNREKHNKWPLTPKEQIRYRGFRI